MGDCFENLGIYLEPLYKADANTEVLASATGFLFGQHLISNWHVYSGKEVKNGMHVNSPCPIKLPTHISIPKRNGRETLLEINILPNTGTNWIECGDDTDVAAIPLSTTQYQLLQEEGWIDVNSFSNAELPLITGEDVYIVGYPFGRRSSSDYVAPILKHGVIASNPRRPLYAGTDCFLVDATTKQGMSGSPVVMIKNGMYTDVHGNMIWNGSQARCFVGIYSGRLVGGGEILRNDQNDNTSANNILDTQSGIVWGRSILDRYSM